MRGADGVALTWVDPLAALPEPADDLRLLRTYPGAPSQGEIAWTVAADGSLSFETRLPRRFGAIGATRHGLFANGAWYPQPLVDGAVPIAGWDVRVALPAGATGALGDRAGQEALSWTGCGERASLAVVERGRLGTIEGQDGLVVLMRGRPRRALRRELAEQLALVPAELHGVIVVSPSRRRLVRHGPGLAYLSDRAFRLTPGLRFAHRRAVVRGLLAAFVPDPDPQDREIAAASLGLRHAAALRGSGADQLLGAFRWIPQVNGLLASRRTPFYSEILDRRHPGDPVRDDLMEVLDPYAPGAAVLAQISARHGPDVAACTGLRVGAGEPPAAALQGCGGDPGWLGPWQGPYPEQDYVLEVGEDALVVRREAPPDAPDEAVEIAIDGEATTRVLGPGVHEIPLDDPPRKVVLDPGRHTAQQSRLRDTWPARYDVTFAMWIASLNLSQGQLFGSLFTTLRRLDDTHNLLIGTVSNSRQDLVSLDVSFLRKEGPLLDGWTRPHRLQIRGGLSVFNPSFAQTDARVGLETRASWAHDTRVNGDFPTRGHRIGVGVGGGAVPGTADRWIDATAQAVGVISPHPRHALAARASVGIARSTLPQRRLTMGGAGLMRSIPALGACLEGTPQPCSQLVDERAVVAFEYRAAALRNLSVPLLLAWGSEIQLAVGAEATVARQGDRALWATGATVGLHALGDVLGAETMGLGVTAAWPLAFDPALEELALTPVPEIYLRLTQAF